MKVYYFGFGANRDPRMIEAIIGKLITGRPAYVDGFELCVQGLKDIPEKPREILRKAWGNSFESYVLRKGNARIYGTLFEMSREDREHISNWELVPEGWAKDTKVIAILEDVTKIKAMTESIENQTVNRIVDGKQYETYLMKPEQIWQIAKRVRK